jgi:hypothetical protein
MTSQVRTFRAFGVREVVLANEPVDAAGLAWLADELDSAPGFSPDLRCAGAHDLVAEILTGNGWATGSSSGCRTRARCSTNGS